MTPTNQTPAQLKYNGSCCRSFHTLRRSTQAGRQRLMRACVAAAEFRGGGNARHSLAQHRAALLCSQPRPSREHRVRRCDCCQRLVAFHLRKRGDRLAGGRVDDLGAAAAGAAEGGVIAASLALAARAGRQQRATARARGRTVRRTWYVAPSLAPTQSPPMKPCGFSKPLSLMRASSSSQTARAGRSEVAMAPLLLLKARRRAAAAWARP